MADAPLSREEALALAKSACAAREAAQKALSSSSSTHTHVLLPSLGVAGYAHTHTLAAALTRAAEAVGQLDSVATHAKGLTASLSAASASAEHAVVCVRELDAIRGRLQQVLDRVEDLIDLRGCVSGVSTALGAGDWEGAALCVRRFHAVERALPVPDTDVAVMRDAENTLLARVTAMFDDAIAAQQRRATGGSAAAPAAEVADTISKCCQYMSILGHSRMGLDRYLAFACGMLRAECMEVLRALAASTGIDVPASAINALSTMFSTAVAAFDSATKVAETSFATEGGVIAVIAALHGVVDVNAARLVLSFAKSGRVQAALAARMDIISRCEDRELQRAAAKPSFDLPARADTMTESLSLTAADAGKDLAALEEESSDAPLAAHVGTVAQPTYRSIDFSDLGIFDSLLDEVAIALQRCASYFRIIAARASARGANGSPHPGSPAASVEDVAVLQAAQRLRGSCADLSGKFNSMQQASVHAGVAKALSLDEVVEEGAAGASIDLSTVASLTSALPRGGAHGEPGHGASAVSASLLASNVLEGAADEELTESGAGAGAVITSLVDDAFYVVQRAGRRALATGHPDSAATCINHAVHALSDRLGSELEARLRVALDEGVPSGSAATDLKGMFSIALSQPQIERVAALKRSIMTSTPVRMAAARLAEYQALTPTGVSQQQLPVETRPAASAASAAGAAGMLGSPFRLAIGARSNAATPVPDISSPAHGGSSAAPVARLTEEVAAVALALNNIQLAACCAERLHSMLSAEATSIFVVAKEMAKVNTSLGGVMELAGSFRKLCENGLRTLMMRLTPRLRSAMHVFDGASALVTYELTEEMFSSTAEGANAFSAEFLPVLASILAPYQFALTPPLSAALVLQVASFIAKHLETRIRRKRFNQLGALQFDADMRMLVTFFTARSSRVARWRFHRLLQTAQLLLVEAPADVMDMPALASPAAGGLSPDASSGASAGSWELSADDIRAILSLRVDFAPADVAHLKLPAHL